MAGRPINPFARDPTFYPRIVCEQKLAAIAWPEWFSCDRWSWTFRFADHTFGTLPIPEILSLFFPQTLRTILARPGSPLGFQRESDVLRRPEETG